MYVQTSPLGMFDSVEQDPRYVTIRDSHTLETAMNRLRASDTYAIDTEASGLAWYRHSRICGWVAATDINGEMRSYYLPFRHVTGEQQLPERVALDAFRELCETPQKRKIFHNRIFDHHMILREGIDLRGEIHDTMILCRLFDENSPAALKWRTLHELQRSDARKYERLLIEEIERLAKRVKMKKKAYTDLYGYSQIPVMMAGAYGGRDGDYTLSLFRKYERDGTLARYCRSPQGPEHPGVYQTEMALQEPLVDMEEAGLPVAADELKQVKVAAHAYQERLDAELWQMMGQHNRFDVNHDESLRWWLQNVMGVRLWKRTKSGATLAVDKEVLGELESKHPAIALVSRIRAAQKIKTTYTDSILNRLDAHGRLHCSYKQVGTETGRLSSADPNMQNIIGDSNDRAIHATGKSIEEGGHDPLSVKHVFFVEEGKVRVYLDWSQIELRVLAFYSGDPAMTRAYINDEDIHAMAAFQVFGAGPKDKVARRKAKALNFGLSYGLGPGGYSRSAGVSIDQAREDMNKFFATYANILPFRESLVVQALQNGCAVDNIFGRTRRMPGLLDQDEKKRAAASRRLTGSIIQGSAAEIAKASIVRIWQWLVSKNYQTVVRIVQNVHDEIALDMPVELFAEVVPMCKYFMEYWPVFHPIPIKTDVEATRTRWNEKQEVKFAA